MIKDINQLKKERPDLVESFEKMTKEELLNQCYLECRDAINMESRVALFMEKCTLNMSKTTYTINSLCDLINEKNEHDYNEIVEELKNNWISVEDRLPEQNQSALVFIPKYDAPSNVDYTQFDAGSKYYYWDRDTYGYEKHEVTHWQPLPTPPKQ